jgi:hypothetical protein
MKAKLSGPKEKHTGPHTLMVMESRNEIIQESLETEHRRK